MKLSEWLFARNQFLRFCSFCQKNFMRKKIVAANWKMNMTQAESERFVQSLLLDLGDITDVEVVIVPPFTAIAKVMEALGASQSIKVGAQNMHWEPNGPFTGEISAALLRDLLVRYVVLGHSERRILFGETDEIVNRKVRAAQEAHAFIRHTLCEISDEATADRIRIQYGGSVKPENARDLMTQPDIDGALVGGASLDPRTFAQIVKAARDEK